MLGVTINMDWDVFICHASEDKDSFARPLARALEVCGFRVWFDEFTLRVGDSLRRSIDHGLANAKYGVVILSQKFFAKEWPQKELDGLVSRETQGQKVILPVWHNISRAQVAKYSPLLADRLAVPSTYGMHRVVSELLLVLDKSADVQGQVAQTIAPAPPKELVDPRRNEARRFLEEALQKRLTDSVRILNETVPPTELQNQIQLVLDAKRFIEAVGVQPRCSLQDAVVRIVEEGGKAEYKPELPRLIGTIQLEMYSSLLSAFFDPSWSQDQFRSDACHRIHPSYADILPQLTWRDAIVMWEVDNIVRDIYSIDMDRRWMYDSVTAPLKPEDFARFGQSFEVSLSVEQLEESFINLGRLGIFQETMHIDGMHSKTPTLIGSGEYIMTRFGC